MNQEYEDDALRAAREALEQVLREGAGSHDARNDAIDNVKDRTKIGNLAGVIVIHNQTQNF